jgi:hypothetical protein
MTPDERNKRKMEIRQKMQELSEDENMIDGIYNYCDRWCERCPFTSRCRVYQMEADRETETIDGLNKQFWEELALNFEVCIDMIKEAFPDIDTSYDHEALRFHVYQEIDAEAKALDYGFRLRDWIKENSVYLEEKAVLFSNYNAESVVSMLDSLEVLRWYGFFISVKIQGASLNLRDDLKEMTDFGNESRDLNVMSSQNGSAKIALIAIEKSMQAWVHLHGCLHEKEDDILQFLSQLSQVKKRVMSQFPHAMDFKRPGFDD